MNDPIFVDEEAKTSWDDSLNGCVKSYKGYSSIVWWKCTKCGESFQRKIAKYLSNRTCPVCTLRNYVHGVNSLEETHPLLTLEWSRLNIIKPDLVMANSKSVVLWDCPKGHTYELAVFLRAKARQNCPLCAGQRIVKGVNDLPTSHPELVEFWDHEKNSFSPYEISSGSKKQAWWRCENGHPHSYLQSINARATRGYGCSYCSGHRVLKGFNDVATLFPHLLEEWSNENNFDLSEVTKGSSRKCKWDCSSCNNSWEAPMKSRTNGAGCPTCANRSSFLEEQVYSTLTSAYKGISCQAYTSTMEFQAQDFERERLLPRNTPFRVVGVKEKTIEAPEERRKLHEHFDYESSAPRGEKKIKPQKVMVVELVEEELLQSE